MSDVAGTTTDLVKRSYEIPDFASVVFIDTAGIDDHGALGEKRVDKTKQAIAQADIALLVTSGNRFGEEESSLADELRAQEIPFLVIHNKRDEQPLSPELRKRIEADHKCPVIDFSTRTGCDSLAISIGTSHGAYKFKPEQCHVDPQTGRLVPPPLAFDVLDAVMEKLPGFPIVLHGSSSVPQEYVDMINQYGGKLEAAIGIPEEELRKAAKSAVCKINIDSDSRLAMTAAVRKVFVEKLVYVKNKSLQFLPVVFVTLRCVARAAAVQSPEEVIVVLLVDLFTPRSNSSIKICRHTKDSFRHV